MPEATETPTPIPDIEPLEIDLGEVDIKAARRRVEDRKSKLPERKRAVLLKKALPLLTAASLFLGACEALPPVEDIKLPGTEIPIVQVTEIALEEFKKIKDEFLVSQLYGGEKHQYEGESAKIIERIQNEYGISISSSVLWPQGNELKNNLPWTTAEIAIVAEAMSQLPPSYTKNNEKFPREIHLVKLHDTTDWKGIKSGYHFRHMIIEIPPTFSIDEYLPEPLGEIFGTEGNLIGGGS